MRLADVFIEKPKPTGEGPGNLVSLFAGCGGFDLPFHELGFVTKYFLEYEKYACQTLYDNFSESKPIIHYTDIRKTEPKEVFKNGKFETDVLTGGPPCRGFSYIGYKMFTPETRKEVTDLYPLFLDYIPTLEPRFVVIENVRALISRDYKPILDGVKDDLEYLGYKGNHYLFNAADYGVPQNRWRVFLIYGRDNDLSRLEFKKKPRVSCWNGISDLPVLGLGDGIEGLVNYPIDIKYANTYQQMIRQHSLGVFNHVSRTVTKPNYHAALKIMKPGQITTDLPREIWPRNMDKFIDKWKRIDPNKPCHTITAHIHKDGMGFIHPYQDRPITAREAARIQSFPDNFVWTVSRTQQYKQIGNAVPPLLAKVIADKIMEYI